jgi:PIN domain nuclease of toxin-antitoxin system
VQLLLDTHALLWCLIQPARLGAESRAVIENADNDVLFSTASVWEIAIKASLGRADFQVPPAAIFAEAIALGFVELPISCAAALKVADLPFHHRDPFDRLLIAQAMTEPAMLYTADTTLAAYSELVISV